MGITPKTSIQFLKGVGEKRATRYAKLGIYTVRDLLYHFPRTYIDLSAPYDIASAPFLEPCAVRARLIQKGREQRIRAGLSLFKLRAEDDSGGTLLITIFNAKYLVEGLELDREYIFYGQVQGGLLKKEMAAPAVYPLPDGHAILPVYPQTAGISSPLIRRNILQALEELDPVEDPIPQRVRDTHRLAGWRESMWRIHYPQELERTAAALNRFVFEELLVLSCALSTLRDKVQVRTAPPMKAVEWEPFLRALPFSPTGAQRRVMEEAAADLRSGIPMNRLVQGDVGSGKTLVAAACVYYAAKNGRQSAMMAPTEILAEQHYRTLTALLEPLGIRVELLTGSTKAAARREILARLADGHTHLCVGTHALLSGGVDFHTLGLVVTDEQHRFGVAQRAGLALKGEDPHVLVMSATPIPRTLSLIIYGDLKLSVIDELPAGRQPIDTLLIGGDKRRRALGFVRDALDRGRQAYIVCPLVEQGELERELRPATEYAQELARGELRGYTVSLLHGRMKPKDKESVMRRFSRGEIQVLVSTTVVEVGVDVPNATIILIENAERFGLSQLHQLRGRVGRGKEKSYCILVSDAKGEKARERLGMIKRTTDGFQLAEFDLKSRGPGDFFGHRQHGLPDLRVASLSDNLETMQVAQSCARELLERDPRLSLPEHRPLGQAVADMLHTVGERPN